jgi:hypothetical protein
MCLPHRERKLGVELAGGHTRRGGGDGIGLGRIEQAQLAIDLGGGALDLGNGVDQRQRHALLADGEETPAAFGLRAPQRVRRHIDGTEAVGLASCR